MIETTQITLATGDNLWDKLKANEQGLRYTEQELVDSRELFVWILASNSAIDNLRWVTPRTVTVPRRSSLAEVIATVRATPDVYKPKYFTWVEMDRCLQARMKAAV
jgi:hypothetical protein